MSTYIGTGNYNLSFGSSPSQSPDYDFNNESFHQNTYSSPRNSPPPGTYASGPGGFPPAMAGAFAFAAAASVADGPLPIGEVIGISVIAATAANIAWHNQRVGVQYTLRAAKTGYYPVYQWGSSIPIGHDKLEKGQIYKIGETIQYDPVTKRQWRYSQTKLDNTGAGLLFVGEYTGYKSQIVFVQQMKLANYVFMNGELPYGNKSLY
jgi:hypothetical protein